jgi:hypothetical protein
VCKACIMLEGLNSGNARLGVQRLRGADARARAAAAEAKRDSDAVPSVDQQTGDSCCQKATSVANT